jgi:putative membrane protein
MIKTNITLSFTTTILAISMVGCGDRVATNANQSSMNTAKSSPTMTNSTMNNSTTNSTMTNTTATNTSNASVQDNFWSNAAQGGMAEVELGKLALQKSQNADVKKFAQMMITDHTKANDELKALAAKKSIVLPTDIGDHKETVDDLSKLSGAEFDKEYVEAMVDDHEEDVDFFEDKSDNSDADIKAFTTKTLPTLKKHLEAIKAIQSKMK